MIKILVVEDEFLMRERLVKAIDWPSIGCEVIASAQNGLEAIDIINKYIPDIVITDIKMPKMDGLELCQHIHANFSFIKVIIMTGYGEFSYAQNALKLGVSDYILKPLDRKEVLNSTKKIVNIIENEKKMYDMHKRLDDAITENLTHLRAKIFDDILNGFTFHIEEQNKKLGNIIKNNSIYVIISIEVKEAEKIGCIKGEESYKDFILIKNAVEAYNLKLNNDFIVSITNGMLYVILFFEDSYSISHINDEIRAYAEGLQKYLKEIHEMSISIGISRCCIDVAELCGAFKEAEKRLKLESFFSNDSIVVQINEDDEINENSINYPLSEMSNLLELIKTAEKEGIDEVVRGFFLKLTKSKGCTEEYIKSICVDTVFMCSNMLNEYSKKIEDILGTDTNIYMNFSKMVNMEDVIHWMSDFMSKVRNVVSEKQKIIRSKYIEDALEFINNNYMHDISLAKVAEYIHVHPVHLGRLLRKELCENFGDIVLKVRIENAKKLLRDPDRKAYEVAKRVGVNDSHYFSLLFKKYTGMTLTEFKESL